MIRSALLSFLALPAVFAASSAMAASPACNTAAMAPLPASVPTQEMKHGAPTPASCVSVQAFVERARRPAVSAPAPTTTIATRPAGQPAASAPASGSQGAYVPKTQHDNTPWRFDMNQNGRRMTAEEFDAWMKAKGIRVATGKPGASTAPAAAPAAAKADCKSSASVGC
jgi:hypothetical protein